MTDGSVERGTARGRATRDRIVSSAADLVYRQGAAGTTLDDVRAESGTSKSQIYHYFQDKDDLVRAVIAVQADRVMGAQQPELDAIDSLDKLRAWTQVIIAGARAQRGGGGCPLGSLANEIADHSSAARSELSSGFATWQSALQRGVRIMRDRGELGPEADPDRLATALLAAVQGGLLLAKASHDVALLEDAMAMAVQLVESYATPAPHDAPTERPRRARASKSQTPRSESTPTVAMEIPAHRR